MADPQGSWTGGALTAQSFLKPHQVAKAVFHPTWIPNSLDPSVDALKKARVSVGPSRRSVSTSLKLLLLFMGSALGTLLIFRSGGSVGRCP
ncbi:hypothetical protein [Streptomyces sp. NBC_00443]|uniref:hypothetical protein n=1 Tax=Streptomyces sp. NBC_00443 TaxID=2975743 RepID=UPI002E20010C